MNKGLQNENIRSLSGGRSDGGEPARHADHAGQGLGEALLFDAIQTVATASIGAHAVFADAIDDDASAFCVAFGFTPLIRRPRTLYLPVATALKLDRSSASR